MGIDLKQIKPVDVARLLNRYTPIDVKPINLRDLRRHLSDGGLRVGDGQTFHLLRYAAWLRQVLERPPRDPYAELKERSLLRQRELSLAGRDIGEMPAPLHPEWVARCQTDFRFFCETYFPYTFTLPWSTDHLKLIVKIERAIQEGGLFAVAMPRGSGKTTICECACIWAALTTGAYIALIGSDEGHAAGMLESIKTEFEANDRLVDDFPEAALPIRALEGVSQRAVAQLYTYKGERRRTYIGWTSREVVLPTVAESPASGAVIQVAGITGRIRGMKHKRPDGTSIRPNLVIVDDPQTDESARSPSQCAAREAVLAGAILGLAGPGKKISGIMPCTVIDPGDMADRILDRTLHPEWQGTRFKMVYAWPRNKKLWEEYGRLRAESLRNDGDAREATAFYEKNRAKMDRGAVVAWPERHKPDELSGVQHAMNLRLRDERAFMSEYQNDPLPAEESQQEELTAVLAAGKVNGYARGIVPARCRWLTAFVDVHDRILFWLVAGWQEDFTGYVLDYGTFPDQRLDYFIAATARRTLRQLAPRLGVQGAITAGLDRLTDNLLSRDWHGEEGATARIQRCLIDIGYEPDTVLAFCRRSPHAAVLLPARGRFVGASHTPFAEYRKEKGAFSGFHWRMPPVRRAGLRRIDVDVNYWKSFVYRGFLTAAGDRGSLSLWGKDLKGHRLFADHILGEYRVKTEAQGRVIDEWKRRVNSPDNHWLDCLVGAAAAAAMLGATLLDARPTVTRKRKRAAVAYL